MQESQTYSSGLRTAPSEPRCGRDSDMADEITVSSLKRTNGDTALEFGGIPIAGEGTDDGHDTRATHPSSTSREASTRAAWAAEPSSNDQRNGGDDP